MATHLLMQALACAYFCAVGHLVRDGWPDFKTMLAGTRGTRWEWTYHLSTQWARLTGGAVCTIGTSVAYPGMTGLALGAAITLGFWADQKHGDGQGASQWHDVPFLLVSGLSSVAALAGAGWALESPRFILLFFVATLKPPVWFGAQAILGANAGRAWAEPTRIAAIIFGALIGLFVALLRGPL